MSQTHRQTTQTPAYHSANNLVLDHYHCTFLLPLPDIDKHFTPKECFRQYYSPDTNRELEPGEAQAYLYFTPPIRDILYESEHKNYQQKPLREWRLPKSAMKNWELHLGNKEDEKQRPPDKYQIAHITSVRLYQFYNDIYLLAFRVEPKALQQLKKQPDCLLFKPTEKPLTLTTLTEKDPGNAVYYEQLVMENWLHFTRLARVLYPTFSQQSDENKIARIQLLRAGQTAVASFETETRHMQIPDKLGDNFNPLIPELLSNFNQKNKKHISTLFNHYNKLYDDRLFVSVAYGIAGGLLPEDDLKRLNTFASYVDRQQAEGWSSIERMDGYAYTPEIIQNKAKAQSCALWQGIGGYYTFTDYSNSYLNRGDKFRDFIATQHIPYIYDRMLIQALFYQASLRQLDEQISHKSQKLISDTAKGLKEFSQLRKDFIRFSNCYWHHKLTEQMQGKEIFELQQKALGLDKHYDILKDELERSDEYLLTRQQIDEGKFNTRLTRWGWPLGLIATWFTFFPVLESALKTEQQSIWQRSGNWLQILIPDGSFLSAETLARLIYTLIIPGIIFFVSWLLTRNSRN